MQYTETLLVIGALLIFMTASLFVNDYRMDNDRIVQETEFALTAVGLAQSFIEEACRLSFDEVVADPDFSGPVPQNLTASGSMGADGGEHYPVYDDIDDFHGYQAQVATPRADYTVAISVGYVDSLTLLQSGGGKTLFKELTVRVSSPYMRDTLRCSRLFSYY